MIYSIQILGYFLGKNKNTVRSWCKFEAKRVIRCVQMITVKNYFNNRCSLIKFTEPCLLQIDGEVIRNLEEIKLEDSKVLLN